MASEPKVGDVRNRRTGMVCNWSVFIGGHPDPWVECFREQQARRLSAELSAAMEMREVLRKVEWMKLRDDSPSCVECRRYQDLGHAPDCRLARLIGGDRG